MAETWNPEDIEKGEELPELPSPVSEPQIAYVYDEEKLQAVQDEIGGVRQELGEVRAELNALRDLFSRRLMNDKQKNELIQTVTNGANFACIEPFLYDLILLMDRIEGEKEELLQSVREEIMEILERRGVEKIKVTSEFNPRLYKAVRVTESEEVTSMRVTHIVRSGYTYAGRVVRPAEVVVVKPKKPASPAEA